MSAPPLPESLEQCWLRALTLGNRRKLEPDVRQALVDLDSWGGNISLERLGTMLLGMCLAVSDRASSLCHEVSTVFKVIENRFNHINKSALSLPPQGARRSKELPDDPELVASIDIGAIVPELVLEDVSLEDNTEISVLHPDLESFSDLSTMVSAVEPSLFSVRDPLFPDQDTDPLNTLFEEMDRLADDAVGIPSPDPEPMPLMPNSSAVADGQPDPDSTLPPTPETTPRKRRRTAKPRRNTTVEIDVDKIFENYATYVDRMNAMRRAKPKRVDLSQLFGLPASMDNADNADNVRSPAVGSENNDTPRGSSDDPAEHNEFGEGYQGLLRTSYSPADNSIDAYMRSGGGPEAIAAKEDFDEFGGAALDSFPPDAESQVLEKVQARNQCTLRDLWHDLAPDNDSFAKAETFYYLLCLASNGKVVLDQKQPYSPVKIAATPH